MTIEPSLPIVREIFAPLEEEIKKPFLIKDAVRYVFLALAAAFALVGSIGICLYAFIQLQPIAITLLTISLVGLSILNLIKVWELITPELPEPLRSYANLIYSIATEIFSILALIVLAPVNLINWDPKTVEEINPDETPTLLIHGFLGSSNNWVYLRSRMRAAGYQNIFTSNLGNPLLSIEEYAERIDAKVQEIMALTGRNDIRLVCHSMGGIVARHWRYHHAQNIHVPDIVTLGTPLDGTYLAYLTLGLSSCGTQMFPESAYLKNQQDLASKDTETNYLHIGSSVDFVILPNRSAYHGGAPASKTQAEVLDITGHVAYLFSDGAADLVIDYFKSK